MMRKILVLSANPKDTARLRLAEEVRDIREGLERSRHRDQFDLVSEWAVRPRDLQRAMLEQLPQIVHFSGHGSEEGLFFEDTVGNSKLISHSALASLFRLLAQRVQIDCVVLNGCYSEGQAVAIAQHAPYVIGMRQSVEDDAAIEFAVGFYDALARGDSVEFAFESGKVAMELNGTGGEDLPVLVRGTTGAAPVDTTVQVSALKPSPPADLGANLLEAGADASPLANGGALKVFMVYSYKDEALKEKLEIHLSALKRQNKLQPWTSGSIEAGLETEPLIAAQLDTSQIILLLVTPEFMASDNIFDTQLKRSMERHREGTARVIPIRLKRVDYEGTEFEILKPLPASHEPPVKQWVDQDEAFVQVVEGIRQVVESLTTTTEVASQPHHPAKEQSPAPASSSAAVSRPTVDVAMIQKQKDLAQFLSGLPGPQFNMLVSVLPLPAGILSAPSAPQANRVAELIQWAKGEKDFGLDQLKAIIQELLNPQ